MSTNLILSNFKWKKREHQTRTPNFTNNLRSHAKGHRGHQTANEPEGQVKGTTSQSTSTDGILASEGGHDILTDKPEDEPGTVESCPATPYLCRAAHITPAPTQDPEEDGQRTTRYCLQGPAETLEEIQTTRKRVEARHIAEACRIRRQQIVCGYSTKRTCARIEALHRECEIRVERVQRKWERDWEIKRGEVVVVVEEEEEMGEEEGRGTDDSRPGRREAVPFPNF